MKRRRVEITVETDRILIIRGSRRSIHAWCSECTQKVQMITPDEAAAISRVSTRTIYGLVEAKKIHFNETPEELLVCLESLFARTEEYRRSAR
jgi:hypothetical protein